MVRWFLSVLFCSILLGLIGIVAASASHRPRVKQTVGPGWRSVEFFQGCRINLMCADGSVPSYDVSACSESAMRLHYCPMH